MFDGGSVVDAAVHWERVIAHAQAQQLKAFAELAELRRRPDGAVDEFTVDELAVALQISGAAAGRRLDLALDLTGRLPETLAALERADIDLLRARAISEITRPLAPELAGEVERQVLVRAGEQTAPQLRQALRRAVLRVDPAGAQARHEQRRRDRRIVVTPADDGMAELWAYLPATAAVAIYDTVNGYAGRPPGGDDDRSADQRRADAFVDLVLGGWNPHRTPKSSPLTPGRAQVRVTVAATTLLGLDELPGELDGYGPVSAETARTIAADATWRRLLTDPASGALLDYGHTTYRPPAALAAFVRARDKTCRFPGCRRSAGRCDIDHRTPYPEGPTNAANLDVLCPHHHRLKHRSTWFGHRTPNGEYNWISPAGRHYQVAVEPIGEPVVTKAAGTALATGTHADPVAGSQVGPATRSSMLAGEESPLY